MNRIRKAALIVVAVPVYLIAGLYLSVGVGNVTHNQANTTFAALAVLVAGIAVLARALRRRRGTAVTGETAGKARRHGLSEP